MDEVKVKDAVKIPEIEWDNTTEEEREPYVEECRKNGFVYGVRRDNAWIK